MRHGYEGEAWELFDMQEKSFTSMRSPPMRQKRLGSKAEGLRI